MAVTWPASLPVAQRAGHNVIKGTAVSRIKFAAGNARVVQHCSDSPKMFQLSWLMTETQLDAFVAFWKGDGDYGAADIDGIQHIDSTGLVTSGASGVDSLRFVAGYTCDRVGDGVWQVRAQMERASENVVSAQAYWSGQSWKWNSGDAIEWNSGAEITHI